MALALTAPKWGLSVVGGGGLAVTLIVMLFNPATIYRRLLFAWVTVGAGILGLGGAVELYSKQLPWRDAMSWSTTVAPWHGAVWLGGVVALIWGDLRQMGHGR